MNKLFTILLLLVTLVIKGQNVDKDAILVKYRNFEPNLIQQSTLGVSLLTSKDSTVVYMVVFKPTSVSPYTATVHRDPYMFFEYSDTLSNTLNKVARKFREWRKVAKENNPGKFSKEIDIEVPLKYLSLTKYGNKDFKFYKPDKNKFSFVLYDVKEEPCLRLGEYIKLQDLDQIMAICLPVNVLEELAEALKYSSIQDGLKTKTIDALFK